ncbi:hypothetical protein COO91_01127 [Nostoc flagelliforme CCNUN1]|uniref:Uncharacterized protein n=1 Tax=Nostoc flagelliforme CCNUN1 TaxID=2038116 RepID=A0A2K8SII1_9NOSO|nr:hypothetical protein COO91_01127 [Nostoc flagelliforme CCNUN1]
MEADNRPRNLDRTVTADIQSFFTIKVLRKIETNLRTSIRW